MFLDSLKLKDPLRIYFLGLAKNSQDHVITVSLGTTTYDITVWKLPLIGSPLFRVFYNDSSLDPMDITSSVTSLSIYHLQLSS